MKVVKECEKPFIDICRLSSTLAARWIYDFIDVLFRIIDNVVHSARPVITTNELDKLLAFNCAQLSHIHPFYDMVGGRIEMGRLYKETPPTFMESLQILSEGATPYLSSSYVQSAYIFLPYLQASIVEERDFNFTYDAVLALEHLYLLRSGQRVLERPQYMFMRLAVVSSADNLAAIMETYELLSTMVYFYSSSSIVYAGTTLGQMIPSFALHFDVSSDVGQSDTLTQCAMINYAGGSLGLGVSNYPPDLNDDGSESGSSGLGMLLRVLYDMTSRIGRSTMHGRGRITVYIEPWHPELHIFLAESKRITLEGSTHGRGLFFGVSVPDLFMRRVEDNETWTFFNPDDVPSLLGTYGSAFEDLYVKFEADGLGMSSLPARDVWDSIQFAEMEGLGPAIVFKDAMNRKSNLSHVGCIGFAGQAADSILPSSTEETAMCNTASIVLPAFVTNDHLFDYGRLHDVVKIVTRNLNRMMVVNSHPSLAAAISYVRHRALGIGVTGLAETFIRMRLGFESEAAMAAGRAILETVYHAALESSCELVEVYGPHSSFLGSALFRGELQFDLWNYEPVGGRYDWNALRNRIRQNGVVNGQLVMLSDMGGCARLTGYTDGCEPLLRQQFADLCELGLWNEELRLKLMLSRGSVRFIGDIPTDLKKLYKTAWEIDMEFILQHAIKRGPFVCQSQSIILYRERPTRSWLNDVLRFAWKSGLKTGVYFLRGGKSGFRWAGEDVDTADTVVVEV
ncbi:hypothetical protein CVT26_011184 [Gymnopilus dilepis]|uniref:Ribonucleoside-diphosphate reductase n=1 Tax=Gymnopilus dilepis TaxID=231916 RepID=A0A409VJV3_9AGAR|nr:hypothetical protein CVT26_011184 [Gymnopilus dilepis]